MKASQPVVELTCQELVELVTDYLEDAMIVGERQRFDEHLAACRGCRRYLHQMRQTISLVGHLAEEHIEPQAKSALLSAFRNWKQSQPVAGRPPTD